MKEVGRQKRCRSEEHTSELQSLTNLVCRLLLEKKKKQRRGWSRSFPVLVINILSEEGLSTNSAIVPRSIHYLCLILFMRSPYFFFFFKVPAPPRFPPFSPTGPFPN